MRAGEATGGGCTSYTGAARTSEDPNQLDAAPGGGIMSKMLSARKRLASSTLKFNLAEVSNHPMNPWRRQNEFSASLRKTEETKHAFRGNHMQVTGII